MNTDPHHCSACGTVFDASAPGGLCPRCLLAGAMQPTEPAGTDREPPSIAEVGAAFPQLEIVALVGQGGMGWVFKARQPKLNRLVALKLLPASLAERDAAFAGRFEREGQLLARLHHPNIVAVHDSGAAGGFFYLLMEFVEGVNLRQAMRSARFTPAQALAIVPHICDALQFAHDEGVLHRDIKPENILLDAKGRVKLADFGIAKLMGDGPDESPATHQDQPANFTQTGTTLGTPSYMAPEQRDTPADVDHRADIYSLGVVFYELLTGELPVGKFALPSEISASDPRVDAIVRQALEKERAHRQHSAGEVKTQIETVVADRRADAPAGTPPRLPQEGHSYVTTPEHLATFDGQFFLYRRRHRMLLDDRQLSFARAGTTTVIPLTAIRDLSMGRYPRVMHPAGLAFISVTYEAAGQTQRLFFSPWEGLFGLPSHFNQVVAEWYAAIRETVTAATGRTPGTTAAEKLGVPPNSPALLALLATPLLGLGLLIVALNLAGAKSTARPAEVAPARTLPSAAATAEERPARAELAASFQEYERLLTTLREATFELEVADFGEVSEAERRERRAGIEAKCRALAEQTARLREHILALGQRAAEPRRR